MRVWLSLILLLHTGTSSLIVLAQTTPKSTKTPFSVTISATQTVMKAGAEVRINVVLTNISDREIYINVSGGPGELDYTVSVLDRSGHEAPETKYLRALRGEDASDPGETTTLVVARSFGLRDVKPGETFRSSIDLGKLYDLQPGKYTIQLERIEEETHPVVKSNTITVTVAP